MSDIMNVDYVAVLEYSDCILNSSINFRHIFLFELSNCRLSSRCLTESPNFDGNKISFDLFISTQSRLQIGLRFIFYLRNDLAKFTLLPVR